MNGDISGKVEIEKSNIVFDGNGYTLIAPPDSWALSIGWMSFIDSVITNVTVKNVNIVPDPSAPELSWGILLESTNSVIANCTISNMPDVYGIGIWVQSSGNVIVGNNLTGIHRTAINIGASNNIIVGNSITSCGNAVYFSSASNNTVTGNHIENTGVAVHGWSGNPLPPDLRNFIYYNDFVNNTRDFLNEAIYIGDTGVLLYPALVNVWDNGTVGNYWSNYKGTDANGDGIGETPWVLADSNQDNYPLMTPLEIKNTTPDLFPSPTPSTTPTPSPKPDETTTPTSPSPTTSPSPPLNPESEPPPELPLLIILASLITATVVGWLFYKKRL
jgi:parallel beta-helix repeat protein